MIYPNYDIMCGNSGVYPSISLPLVVSAVKPVIQSASPAIGSAQVHEEKTVILDAVVSESIYASLKQSAVAAISLHTEAMKHPGNSKDQDMKGPTIPMMSIAAAPSTLPVPPPAKS